MFYVPVHTAPYQAYPTLPVLNQNSVWGHIPSLGMPNRPQIRFTNIVPA